MLRTDRRGDTIIEVLIAITIAAFAIGISYSIASKSLQQAILARERSQALNILESQVTDLKFRYKNSSPTDFNNSFAASGKHYCLSDAADSPDDSGWAPTFNNGDITSDTKLSTTDSAGDGNYYDSGCVRSVSGNDYYLDISTDRPYLSVKNPTIYHVHVRWERLGGGPINEANIYYRF